jgi:biopolymer transport protein ExbD
MSHGPSSGGETVDPNLTPLLDLVLQLVMLFMICGNYAAARNDPVSLAKSTTAKQLADNSSTQPEAGQAHHDYLFLTVKPYFRDFNKGDLANHLAPESRDYILPKYVDGDAYVVVPGHDAMKPGDELLVWLNDQYGKLQAKYGTVDTSVVIRPDGDMDYAAIYRILKLCKDAHFTNLKVRALIATGTES